MGVPPESLDDACQEVFLEAFRYLPRFRGECSFKTWLYRLCSTQARKARMRRRVQQTLLAILPGEVFRTVGEIGHSESDTESLIHRGLSSLNDKERLVFVLYELEGLSGREIVKIADCPEATVWRRLHYARKKFAMTVEEQGASS
jgi:RNA polymerase sigma-70 factor (ECF subfamily)